MSTEKTIWGNRWEKVKKLTGGAQSRAFLVRDREDLSRPVAFLKEPKNSGEKALNRMEEEANTLKALEKSQLVPNLFDFSKDRTDCYIVMSNISGVSLSKVIEQQLFTIDEGCKFMLDLLQTISECHEKNIVHRDIKPGNIMVPHGTKVPYIVDFGVGYRHDESRKDLTHVNESVGNRFAQAPETVASSKNQRSPVQDLSNACSIFLYVLTGQETGQYLDEAERLPHQRPAAEKILNTIEHPKRAQLLAIFDRAFTYGIKKRFQSANELNAAIYQLLSPIRQLSQNTSDHQSTLLTAFGRPTLRTEDESDKLLLTVVDLLKQVYTEVRNELPAGFEFEVSTKDSDDFGVKRTLVTRMYHSSNDQRDFPCSYLVSKIGSQCVITTNLQDHPNLGRTDFDLIKTDKGVGITNSAKEFLLANLSRRLLLPNLKEVHRNIYEYIRESKPKLIHEEVMSLRNPYDESLCRGFEELSWLLEKHNIALVWRIGPTLLPDSEPRKADMPHVLEIGLIGLEHRLRFWRSGQFEALNVATHNFPGGIVTKQLIVNQFTDKFLKGITQDKIIPPLQD